MGNITESIPKQQDKGVHIDTQTEFVPENRIWFWDSREDPFKPGPAKWQGYDEVTSMIIEEHLFNFINKKTKNPLVEIDPNYQVNVKSQL